MSHMICVSLAAPAPAPAPAPPTPLLREPFTAKRSIHYRRSTITISFASKSGRGGGFSLNPILTSCQTCRGKGAIECPGCKGTGKNKKNGNIFERWKCFECQGFGLKSCPSCGKEGLTPEQRGER